MSVLVIDSAGNLYGTTYGGGAYQEGAVFKLTPDGTETVLHSFNDLNSSPDGSYPVAGVIRDKNGNIYGTTVNGGPYNSGTVFKLSPSGTETILYSFGVTSTDGGDPYGPVVLDSHGNLYGVTVYGGAHGYGTVYEISAAGVESILYSFTKTGSDGGYPEGPLVFDSRGNLYGTTEYGGTYGYGTVFRLSPNGTETVLHSFGFKNDGQHPVSGVVLAKNGDMYGTTTQGGALRAGAVFKLSPNGQEWVHSITPSNGEGAYPMGGLVLDASGNLYGTTTYGGTASAGAVYELKADGTMAVLHDFAGSSTDGSTPYDGLTMDSAGNLYGTTYNGGATNFSGTVYKITP
jgi:uncharacterized repeat protein (TIGR03803 family)